MHLANELGRSITWTQKTVSGGQGREHNNKTMSAAHPLLERSTNKHEAARMRAREYDRSHAKALVCQKRPRKSVPAHAR